MQKVINLSRDAAKEFSAVPPRNNQFFKELAAAYAGDFVWISIGEPDDIHSVISNPILDKWPTLKLNFWDLREDVEYKGEIIGPPDIYKIAKIVNFLVKHRDKNVIVNCAAGISRSGAVAQFCKDILKYEWPQYFKDLAWPNPVIYRDMVTFYNQKYLK